MCPTFTNAALLQTCVKLEGAQGSLEAEYDVK
jgi:hypothetical protein